jgi:hypothetical protein
MSRKYKKLIEQILVLHDLHQKLSPSDIANELQSSDCPPLQTRRALVRFINYTIKRGTVNARKRSGRPRTARTKRFIMLIKSNIETNENNRSEKHDIKIRSWKIARS